MPLDPTLQRLATFESRNITFVEPDGSWPIVWARARGAQVWDTRGRRYVDLTAAFGVAATGHANPVVVRAAQRQLARLPHAMGDVHPHPLKGLLAEALSGVTFERWTRGAPRGSRLRGKTIFGNSGFEAVEAALKTAVLATGKPGIAAFTGAYHGLGYGALNATHRDYFRGPFRRQLAEFGHFLAYPTAPEAVAAVAKAFEHLCRRQKIGAVLVEPVQGRGGIRVPPPAFLPHLRRLCDRHRVLLIVDEVFTGFGRTGRWFACEHTATVPDLICLGKALTGGFPLSACVGQAPLMDRAWPRSTGEAIHTSTFLGNPVGCAMALAQIEELRARRLPQAAARLGRGLLRGLAGLAPPPGLWLVVRGLGLMVGMELRTSQGRPATAPAWQLVKQMLAEGFTVLPEGEHGNVIALTPPLVITATQLAAAVAALRRALTKVSVG